MRKEVVKKDESSRQSMAGTSGEDERGLGLPEGPTGLELSVRIREWREMRLESRLGLVTLAFLIAVRSWGCILRAGGTLGSEVWSKTLAVQWPGFASCLRRLDKVFNPLCLSSLTCQTWMMTGLASAGHYEELMHGSRRNHPWHGGSAQCECYLLTVPPTILQAGNTS